MKICSKCGKKWQDEFKVCPICGVELLPEPQKDATVSLGDSNAVSGGIHTTTDNSVKHDNSVASSHNTTNSHNTTTNTTTNTTNQTIYNGTVTKIEREKSQEEILKERKLKFRECCKTVLLDGLLTAEERIWLEEQRVELDLSAEMASHILNEVNSTHQRKVMSMGTVQRIQFNNLKRAVEGNMVDNVRRLMPQIKVIAGKFQEEELQYLYHMVLAALSPQECVDTYTQRKEDRYWLTFWTYVALHKQGDIANAEIVMIDLGKWQGLMPDENLVLLGALGSLIEGDKETAQELYMQAVTTEYSPLLANLTEVIVSILNYDPNNGEILASLTRNRFYVDNFLKAQYDAEVNRYNQRVEEERKRREEEERQRREEEERKRKEAEEKARREAEEKRRLEEERRRREEEERKRREEERKRREEEERRRREAEEKARREAEEKRRLEEERKRREEEERKRKEAEEKARREAEEKRRLEEERKRREEEERKRKEAERLAMIANAEAEEAARREAEEKHRLEEERKRREAEERAIEKAKEEARRDAAEKARLRAEEERKRAEQERKRKEAEEKARREAEEAARQAARPRFCRKCGNPLRPGAVFCNKCGTKI